MLQLGILMTDICYSASPQIIYDALRDLVSFVQFKKREKHPWRSVALLKLQVLSSFECFSRFLNFTNGTKSRKTSPINLQKMIFLAYRSASFYFQSLLMTSEFYVRKREVCKHWNPSAIDLARLSLQSVRANYEKMSITSNSGFNSTFTPTLSVQT